MCGRYVSRVDAALERAWALSGTPPFFESYNVAPSQRVPVVRDQDTGRECVLLRWGLVPFWARGIPPKYSTINARLEGLQQAASYRGPWKRGQRCILPALGFYEWHVEGRGKQPYYIYLPDREVFGLAGLWERSETDDGRVLESCTIITLPANALLAEIHNARQRMPAILRREDHDTWLAADSEAALGCLAPYPDDQMAAHRVSTRVNSPRNNDARLTAAVD